MQSDGRIRSKDIGTGEVNSRIVSDLYSDTYDGDKVDPEADPGTSGWILLKNGLAVFNQAIIRGTITAAEIIGAVIRGSEVNIREGGRLTVGGDPTAVPPVNPVVVLDESGLSVIGGFVTPIWAQRFVNSSQDISLSTTATTIVTLQVTPPSWVQTVILQTALSFQMTNLSGGNQQMQYRVDANGSPGTGFVTQSTDPGRVNHQTRTRSFLVTSFPITVNGVARVDTSTNNSNQSRIDVTALGVRN